jgi:hypothetical protein
MANNYTQFSIEVANITDAERAFFVAEKAGENRLDDGDGDEPVFADPMCDIDIEGNSVYLCSMDGDAEYAAELLQRFFAEHRPEASIIFGVAFICSKPRPGEFGGMAYLVTKETIEVCNPEHELRNRLERT